MISVVIPTLNEEVVLEETIASILTADGVEIIIADGGSSDLTLEIARHAGCQVVSAEGGRGGQMNAGAELASGEVLLFLHADTILPEGWYEGIVDSLNDPAVAGGAFEFSTGSTLPALRAIGFIVNIRSKYLGLPYGDQAIFVRRSIFEEMGCYRNMPLMEDVDFMRRMRRYGKIQIIDLPVVTSARRWEEEGWIKTTVRNQILLYLYLLGVSPERLYRFYRAVR